MTLIMYCGKITIHYEKKYANRTSPNSQMQ